jgi:1-deoxy-D-xylulose-5-phosphate synthase
MIVPAWSVPMAPPRRRLRRVQLPALRMAIAARRTKANQLLSTAHAQNQPVAVRYRAAPVWALQFRPAWTVCRSARVCGAEQGIAILAFGTLLHPALAAREARRHCSPTCAGQADVDYLLELART